MLQQLAECYIDHWHMDCFSIVHVYNVESHQIIHIDENVRQSEHHVLTRTVCDVISTYLHRMHFSGGRQFGSVLYVKARCPKAKFL
jgi:hypothetical protein